MSTQPMSVERAREACRFWSHGSVTEVASRKKLDALIAAVRAERDAEWGRKMGVIAKHWEDKAANINVDSLGMLGAQMATNACAEKLTQAIQEMKEKK